MKRRSSTIALVLSFIAIISIGVVVTSTVSKVYGKESVLDILGQGTTTTTPSTSVTHSGFDDLNIGGESSTDDQAHAQQDPSEDSSTHPDKDQVEAPGMLYQAAQPIGRTLGNSGLAPGTKIIVITDRSNGTVKFDTCTVAFSLPGRSGMPWSFTAGHCGTEGEKVYTMPENRDFRTAWFLGTVRKTSTPNYDTRAGDWAGIRLSPKANRPGFPKGIPQVLDTNSRPQNVTLCKWGSTTGYNCGPHLSDGVKTHLGSFGSSGHNVTARLNQVQLCALPGDSGGPIFDQTGIVGILSSTSASAQDVQRKSCQSTSLAYYTPMRDVVTQVIATIPDAMIKT